MADTKISALTLASPVLGTDEIPVNRSGANYKITAGGIAALGSGVGKLNLTPSSPGNFTVAHGLGASPSVVLIQMSSGGQIWLQNPTSWDATNIYCAASDSGVTGVAYLWR